MSAVHLDELSGQRKPEPRTLALFRVVVSYLAEFLENHFLILQGNADAGVADRDLDAVCNRRCVDADIAALGSELDRIGQKIEQDLLELDRKSTRLNSSHGGLSRMPSSA